MDWIKPKRLTCMSREEYAKYPEKIQVREVKIGKKIRGSTFLKRLNNQRQVERDKILKKQGKFQQAA